MSQSYFQKAWNGHLHSPRPSVGDGVDILPDIAQLVAPLTGNARKPGFVVSFRFRRGKHQHHLNRSGGHAVWNLCREAMSRVDLAGDANGRHNGMSLKFMAVSPLYRGDFKARTGTSHRPFAHDKEWPRRRNFLVRSSRRAVDAPLPRHVAHKPG